MRVLVTGANGFIAKNLLARLSRRGELQVHPVTRESSTAEFTNAVENADFVFHLAGVNRPQDPAEFRSGNIDSTRQLCDRLSETGRRIPIVYTSSIQATRDNPYGRSKREAEDVLREYRASSGSPIAIYRLPNVFGKWCRPNYNSAVATFCHNIARDLPIQIGDASVTLVYVDDVIDEFARKLDDGGRGDEDYYDVRPTYTASVNEIADTIRSFREGRHNLVSEAVGVGLLRALYATYISYLPTASVSYPVPKHADPRGVFVEMLKTRDSGQFSYFTAHPGVTRGGHYHDSKTEKFLVIKGRARFGFRHILTGETFEVDTRGDEPRIVETIPGWAHNITNVGDEEMIVMLWANEIFDRDRPDTYSHPV